MRGNQPKQCPPVAQIDLRHRPGRAATEDAKLAIGQGCLNPAFGQPCIDPVQNAVHAGREETGQQAAAKRQALLRQMLGPIGRRRVHPSLMPQAAGEGNCR